MLEILGPCTSAMDNDETSSLLEWPSKVPAPGRAFAATTESELHPVLRTLAARLTRRSGSAVVIPEMPLPFGVPDLVALADYGDALTGRLESELPPLKSLEDARIVLSCSTGNVGRSAIELARALETGLDAAHRRAQRLARSGWLTKSEHRWRSSGFHTPLGSTHSFEAKVSDWRGGLTQAVTYGTWTDTSTVVMLRLPKNQSAAIESAKRFGIGLAIGDKWLVKPRRMRLSKDRRLLARERLIAALLGDKSY